MLNLEQLPKNDLPLPKYESEHSAGIDFSACLTRPCRHVPEGATFKQTQPFVCCGPTQQGATVGGSSTRPPIEPDHRTQEPANIRLWMSNKRLPIDPDGDWDYIKAETIRLTIWPGETVMVPLGLKSEFPETHVLTLHVRSSTGMRGLGLANQTGIIDADFRGEIMAILYNRNKDTPIVIEHGERIVQGIMFRVDQANVAASESLSETDRGEGGFGSTNSPSFYDASQHRD